MITNQISPIDLQYEIKKLGLSQRVISKKFKVTDGAISGAINNDPLLSVLRVKIIRLINQKKKSLKAA
jgi:hypothetical protein